MNFKKWYEVFESPSQATGVTWYDDDTEQQIPSPHCGLNLAARFAAGTDEYWVRFEEVDANAVIISFGTKRNGVFMTKAGTPFTVLSQVFGVIGQFLQACPQIRFTFTGYSEARNRVFTRLIAKFFPAYTQDEEGFYFNSSSSPPTP